MMGRWKGEGGGGRADLHDGKGEGGGGRADLHDGKSPVLVLAAAQEFGEAAHHDLLTFVRLHKI